MSTDNLEKFMMNPKFDNENYSSEDEKYNDQYPGEKNILVSARSSKIWDQIFGDDGEESKSFIDENVKIVKIRETKIEFYEGELDEKFIRNGYGAYTYENGEKYEGEFENGLRSGSGEYHYSDGSIYRGEWLNDKKMGFGSYKYGVYEINGQWEDDKFMSGFAIKISTLNKEDNEIISDFIEHESEQSRRMSKTKSQNELTIFLAKKYRSQEDEIIYINEYKKSVVNKMDVLNKKSSTFNFDLIPLPQLKTQETKLEVLNTPTKNQTHRKSVSYSGSDITKKACHRKSISICQSTVSLIFKKVNFKCRSCLFGKYLKNSSSNDKIDKICKCEYIKNLLIKE
jgi:hypothetical protein